MRLRSSSATVRVSAAALVMLALGGCGSETADPGDGVAASEDEFDVTSATLTDEPFCDRVDTAMVAELLAIPEEEVKLQVDRQVGEEFEGAVEEAGPSESVANLCVLGTGTSQLLVSVQPDASAADVQETVDELASLAGTGSSESCSTGDAAAFGEPSAAFTCEAGPPLERMRVVVTGLVGDSKFFCSSIVNEGAGDELPAATIEVCETMLQELAES